MGAGCADPEWSAYAASVGWDIDGRDGLKGKLRAQGVGEVRCCRWGDVVGGVDLGGE
jgi:hypothetical protein